MVVFDTFIDNQNTIYDNSIFYKSELVSVNGLVYNLLEYDYLEL